MPDIPLYGGKARGRVAHVDEADIALVSPYHWNVEERDRPGRSHGPYARAATWENGRAGAVFMHCLIMGQRYIDHIDGHGLNNRRGNLRPATTGQNMANRRKNLRGSSSFKGVTWNTRLRKWVASVSCDKKKHHLGVFASEDDAARAYDAAAVYYFGEYARLNFAGTEAPLSMDEATALGNCRTPSSAFRGVSRNKGGGWRVSIMARGEKRRAGPFASEVDAALSYDAMAREMLGEHAKLNFPTVRDIPAGAVLLDQKATAA